MEGRHGLCLFHACTTVVCFVFRGGVSYHYRHNDRTICPPFLITGPVRWLHVGFKKSRLEVCFTCQVMESLLKKCSHPLSLSPEEDEEDEEDEEEDQRDGETS